MDKEIFFLSLLEMFAEHMEANDQLYENDIKEKIFAFIEKNFDGLTRKTNLKKWNTRIL